MQHFRIVVEQKKCNIYFTFASGHKRWISFDEEIVNSLFISLWKRSTMCGNVKDCFQLKVHFCWATSLQSNQLRPDPDRHTSERDSVRPRLTALDDPFSITWRYKYCGPCCNLQWKWGSLLGPHPFSASFPTYQATQMRFPTSPKSMNFRDIPHLYCWRIEYLDVIQPPVRKRTEDATWDI